MNKKYQVFVSSTYNDLKEERQAVIQVLLKMGFIPVGMEQFPASNMGQMEYIEMMLDSCDYYLLILAGKYGTIDTKDGIGYTEKEYNYAIEKGIPVMSFLFRDIDKLERKQCEKDAKKAKLLKAFRGKISKNKMVDFYDDIGSLTTAVATAVHFCVQHYPAKGWVRGDNADGAAELEKAVEKYLEEHTATKEDIDAIFAEIGWGDL